MTPDLVTTPQAGTAYEILAGRRKLGGFFGDPLRPDAQGTHMTRL